MCASGGIRVLHVAMANKNATQGPEGHCSISYERSDAYTHQFVIPKLQWQNLVGVPEE
jgi:hypothetical protein